MDSDRKPEPKARGGMVPGLPVTVPPRTLSDEMPPGPQDSDQTAWHFGGQPEEETPESELAQSGGGRHLLHRLTHRG
jgi:hypothetical protein